MTSGEIMRVRGELPAFYAAWFLSWSDHAGLQITYLGMSLVTRVESEILPHLYSYSPPAGL